MVQYIVTSRLDACRPSFVHQLIHYESRTSPNYAYNYKWHTSTLHRFEQSLRGDKTDLTFHARKFQLASGSWWHRSALLSRAYLVKADGCSPWIRPWTQISLNPTKLHSNFAQLRSFEYFLNFVHLGILRWVCPDGAIHCDIQPASTHTTIRASTDPLREPNFAELCIQL